MTANLAARQTLADSLIAQFQGQLFIRPHKEKGAYTVDDSRRLLGLVDGTVEFSGVVEETDVMDTEAQSRSTRAIITDSREGTLTFNLRQIDRRNLALALSGDLEAWTQSSASSQTQTATNVVVGEGNASIYQLLDSSGDPARNVTVTGIEDDAGSPVSYTEGTDYYVNSEDGTVEFIQSPAGATANAVISFDIAAISSDAYRVGLLGNTEQYFNILLVNTNEQGPRWHYEFLKCRLNNDASINLVGVTSETMLPMAFRVLADVSEPIEALQLGSAQFREGWE